MLDAQTEFSRLLAAVAAMPSSPQSRISNSQSKTWQEWREEDGRWVAVGHIPPGHAADPPQFAPRPGEVLSTPAVPLEAF